MKFGRSRTRLSIHTAGLAFALAMALGFRPPCAHAAEPATDQAKAESRRRFELGETHFHASRFTDALAEYEAGYKLVPLPGFLINIAHCHRLTGELRKSRAHYRKFLFVEPLSPRRREVEEVIAELDRAISEVESEAASGSAVVAVRTATRPAVPRDARSRAAASDFWVWSAMAGAIVGPTVVSETLAR